MNFFFFILLIVAFVTALPSQPSVGEISNTNQQLLAELKDSQMSKGIEAILANKTAKAVEIEKLCLATNSTLASCENGNGNGIFTCRFWFTECQKGVGCCFPFHCNRHNRCFWG